MKNLVTEHVSLMKHLLSALAFGIVLISCSNENKEIKKTEVEVTKNVDTSTAPKTIETIEPIAPIEPPQTEEERVADIRKWYAEINGLTKRNCRVKKRTEYDGLAAADMPFEQKVTACQLNDTYELIEGEFNGYESGSTVHVYKKEGKIFFIFVEGGAESWSYERRYYCDKDENIIRFLEREGEGGDEPSGAQNTKKLKNRTTNIRDYEWVGDDISKIEKILKEKI